jgi:hypothetical protein
MPSRDVLQAYTEAASRRMAEAVQPYYDVVEQLRRGQQPGQGSSSAGWPRCRASRPGEPHRGGGPGRRGQPVGRCPGVCSRTSSARIPFTSIVLPPTCRSYRACRRWSGPTCTSTRSATRSPRSRRWSCQPCPFTRATHGWPAPGIASAVWIFAFCSARATRMSTGISTRRAGSSTARTACALSVSWRPLQIRSGKIVNVKMVRVEDVERIRVALLGRVA